MARWTIRCPKCRKAQSSETRHGMKTFMLMHGVKCSARNFNISQQYKLEDFFPDLKEAEDGGD